MAKNHFVFDAQAALSSLAIDMKTKTAKPDGSGEFLKGLKLYAGMIVNSPATRPKVREEARLWEIRFGRFTE